MRDFVSNLENAYWDLYFAYRDLDTKIKARDEALETWRNINALHQANRRGGETDKEAQAREQYFQFEEDVQNALVGRELDGTRTYNGSTPGTFRGSAGRTYGGAQVAIADGIAADRRPTDPAQRRAACLLRHFRLARIGLPSLVSARGIAPAAMGRQGPRIGTRGQPATSCGPTWISWVATGCAASAGICWTRTARPATPSIAPTGAWSTATIRNGKPDWNSPCRSVFAMPMRASATPNSA